MKIGIKPRELSWLWRGFDILMSPLMRAISGALVEKPQETHRWHIQRLPHHLVHVLNKDNIACSTGKDLSNRRHGEILFHIPVLSGWQNYVVVEVGGDYSEWYVGWILYSLPQRSVLKFDIHRLPIQDKRLRLLNGVTGLQFCFFAINKNGEQLPLKIVAEGHIGDGKHPKIRLF